MEDTEVNNIDDLAGTDPDVYHVVLSVDNKIYDGSGETSIDNLLKMSVFEYNDFSPVYLSGVGIEENALKTVIEFDTNWSISEVEFYNFLKEIPQSKNKSRSSNKLR